MKYTVILNVNIIIFVLKCFFQFVIPYNLRFDRTFKSMFFMNIYLYKKILSFYIRQDFYDIISSPIEINSNCSRFIVKTISFTFISNVLSYLCEFCLNKLMLGYCIYKYYLHLNIIFGTIYHGLIHKGINIIICLCYIILVARILLSKVSTKLKGVCFRIITVVTIL